MDILVLDNVIDDIDEYVNEILTGSFIDVPDGEYVFKGIQPRQDDSLSIVLNNLFSRGASLNTDFIIEG
jgi:hypothetical protein